MSTRDGKQGSEGKDEKGRQWKQERQTGVAESEAEGAGEESEARRREVSETDRRVNKSGKEGRQAGRHAGGTNSVWKRGRQAEGSQESERGRVGRYEVS